MQFDHCDFNRKKCNKGHMNQTLEATYSLQLNLLGQKEQTT